MLTDDDQKMASAELTRLEREIERLDAGVINAEIFKKIRLYLGIYGMRGETNRYMIRIGLPLGIVTPGQIHGLASIIDDLSSRRTAHLTTRQDIQVYGIERHRLVETLKRLGALGLSTRETSGNVVRNVACCPYAGVSPQEPFDVIPYAMAVRRYFLRNPLTQVLPRKIKIAFEGCLESDHARTPIQDIGVVASTNNGAPGFRIFIGGGLGSHPRVARLLEPWTSPDFLIPTLEAIIRVFDRLGERRQRAKARLKFLVERLGWEEFCRVVLEERQSVWAAQSGRLLTALDLHIDEERYARAEPVAALRRSLDPQGLAQWRRTNVFAQKQAGLAAVTVRISGGDVTPMHLRSIAEIARRYAQGIRFTNGQNILLRSVAVEDLPLLYDDLKSGNLGESGVGRLADVTRCPGADTCLSAITHPMGLIEALEPLFRNSLAASTDLPLSIKVSGCPNSCGHHQIADLGLYGIAAKVEGRHIPCYQFLVGGSTSPGSAHFGQRLVRIPSRLAPEAIRRVARFYSHEKGPGEDFAGFLARVGLKAIAREIGDLNDLSRVRKSPELLIDLGATGPFELNAGKGECAA